MTHTLVYSIFLQAGPNPSSSLFLMVGMVVVMYFFMIRPQAKRAKAQKKFSQSIEANEQIITSSGIHGRISKINDDGTLQLEIGRGLFIVIERSAVSMELTAAHRKKKESVTSVEVVK